MNESLLVGAATHGKVDAKNPEKLNIQIKIKFYISDITEDFL